MPVLNLNVGLRSYADACPKHRAKQPKSLMLRSTTAKINFKNMKIEDFRDQGSRNNMQTLDTDGGTRWHS